MVSSANICKMQTPLSVRTGPGVRRHYHLFQLRALLCNIRFFRSNPESRIWTAPSILLLNWKHWCWLRCLPRWTLMGLIVVAFIREWVFNERRSRRLSDSSTSNKSYGGWAPPLATSSTEVFHAKPGAPLREPSMNLTVQFRYH